MLPVPEQRRPPCPRHRERLPLNDLRAAAAVNLLRGWRLQEAHRLPDGLVEVVYVLSEPL